MAEILLNAFRNPAEKNVFYSCRARRETGSEKLNEMGRWEWNPEPREPLEFDFQSEYPMASGTCRVAMDFGCPIIDVDENKKWVEPFISDPAQVKNVEIPELYVGKTKIALDFYKRAFENLPEGYVFGFPDTQSPLGQAELMWDQSFYLALIEHPDAVHELLDKITEFTIRWIKEIQRLGGDKLNPSACPPVWCPQGGRGYFIADDTMSLISPEMHLEYSVPYINRITEECGPVCYHSCTWREEYFDNVHQFKDVLCFNWNPGNSVDPAIIIKEFSGTAVLAPHIVHNMHRDGDVVKWNPDFADESEFVRHFLDSLQDNTSIFFWFSNICENGPVMEKIYELFHERGYTPQAKGLE